MKRMLVRWDVMKDAQIDRMQGSLVAGGLLVPRLRDGRPSWRGSSFGGADFHICQAGLTLHQADMEICPTATQQRSLRKDPHQPARPPNKRGLSLCLGAFGCRAGGKIPVVFLSARSRLVWMVCWGLLCGSAVVSGEGNGQSGVRPGSEPGKVSPTPSSRDQYSGKTVSSKKMAYALVMHREANAPHVGEMAPEFSLKTADGEREVSLAELRRTKPVVLIMASWGCDVFRETVPGLLQLHSQYKDRVHFVMVYIREAHALDGFGVDGVVFDPKTSVERMATARTCRQQLQLPFTLLVDSTDDPVMTRWAAWPVRIYLVGTDGKLAYAGPQGPWGYRPYRGYQHGDGKQQERDLQFNAESLQEFLEKRFPANPSKARDTPGS